METEDKEDLEENEESDSTFPHPKHASAWETQALLLAHKQPDLENIANCQSDISLIAADANNERAILSAKKNILVKIEKNAEIYHWCFYSMMRGLDAEIDKTEFTMKERVQLFLEKMRQLWILARALDQFHGENQYFSYLRQRYVQISQNSFGRVLNVIGNSLDERP